MKTTGRAIAAIMLMFATVLVTGCTEKENNQEENNTGGDIVLAEGDWVDLGLPSGLLWATRNVGASSPTDYGDYFAWADTSPMITWVRCKYAIYENGSMCGWTKYTGTDGLTTLQPEDDAATANYGGRTPTYAEWQELINNTTNRWKTIDGVNGRCFTGSNGNTIFLPAAGSRWGNEIKFDGSDGEYWSSSLDMDFPYAAWACFFSSVRVYQGSEHRSQYRHGGLSVRAVR